MGLNIVGNMLDNEITQKCCHIRHVNEVMLRIISLRSLPIIPETYLNDGYYRLDFGVFQKKNTL